MWCAFDRSFHSVLKCIERILMESKKQKIISLLISIALGMCIMFAPSIITGEMYDRADLDPFLTANLVIRSSSFVLGLLVIYDATKVHFKE